MFDVLPLGYLGNGDQKVASCRGTSSSTPQKQGIGEHQLGTSALPPVGLSQLSLLRFRKVIITKLL